jgi:ectoine hydroxylase-related dioxygenase (phytanoyl-CoA dioxygenase family)
MSQQEDQMAEATQRDLPKPTRDVARATADIDRFGFCYFDAALDDDLIEKLRQRVVEQAAAEKRLGHAFEDGGPNQQWGAFKDENGRIRPEAFREAAGGVNQRVWMLVNKGEVFLDALTIPDVMEVVRHVLGEEVLLSSYSANIAKPGGVAMPLHTDQWWAPAPTSADRKPLGIGSMTRSHWDDSDAARGGTIAPAACCNVIFMLDPFSEEIGGTRVVPGSHLSGRQPHPEHDGAVETVGAEGKAGTALIIDGRVWHGTGANRGNQSRHGLLATYCGPQFRPQENYTVGTSDAVMAEASDELKALLGLKVWWGYGRTGNPTVDFIDRSEAPLGELR